MEYSRNGEKSFQNIFRHMWYPFAMGCTEYVLTRCNNQCSDETIVAVDLP